MSKRYTKTESGMFKCTECDYAQPSINSFNKHWYKVHGKKAMKRFKKIAKELNSIPILGDNENRAEVKFCPNCGHEVPVAFVYRR